MTFSVRKVPGGTTSLYSFDTWVVEKTWDGGECILIATYDSPSQARWGLDSMRTSIEVRYGAAVKPLDDAAPAEPE